MESQPQNPEFMNNPENFHTCTLIKNSYIGMLQVNKVIWEECSVSV